MAGQKTSVYLTVDVAERVRASGLSLPELVRRGLDADAPPPLEDVIRRVLREELAACMLRPPAPVTGKCEHRVPKGSFCKICQMVKS